MNVAAVASLYQERVGQVTSPEVVDRCVDDLSRAKDRWRETPLSRRIELARACLDGAMAQSSRWIAEACRAKGIEPGTPPEAEETAAGPMATLRYLALLIRSLSDLDRYGHVRLPGPIRTTPTGQLTIPVLPTRGMYDAVLFAGLHAEVWMQPGVTRENLDRHIAIAARPGAAPSGVALVLGAGNVSSIAPTDAFSKLFQEGKVVLLKMNPVNEYVGGIFAQAFSSLIEAGFLRIIYGGADVGRYAVEHPGVDEVHITGSVYSHDSIVWGPPGPERDRRKAEGIALLEKRITSELGNVTPWVVVPGPYSERELAFQAENLAATIVNNASFNCVATKLIVTARNWPARQAFLDKLADILARVPPRRAYYPGAAERFAKFTGAAPPDGPAGTLPWTLVRDVSPARDPQFLEEESFVCVCAETALDADTPAEFLRQVPDFVNDRLWGNLGIGLTIHPSTRRETQTAAAFNEAIAQLRFGTIGINAWPALGYAVMCTPWGGFPEGTLEDPRSGMGWVHNTYLLDAAQKTIIEGPLATVPKPTWFPTHRTAHVLARRALDITYRPAWWKLPSLILPSLRG